MSLAATKTIQLNYGAAGRFALEIDAQRVLASADAPPPNPRFRENLRQALEAPLDFPPLEQSVIPDDQIVLALDTDTPEAAALVAAAWDVLQRRGVRPENVTVIQPSDGERPLDPRAELPDEVRQLVGWKRHSRDADDECAYLAATTGGERIYLNRSLAEADVVVSIGRIAFDPLMGYRGTNSVLFPGLSNAAAAERAQGQGHSELGPDDERPLRQLVDEIGWLLGTQFALQVIPASGGGVADVLAGASDSVFRRGRELLAGRWLVEVPERPEIVVAAIDVDAGGHAWRQVASAAETARNLVARGGKIVLLTELQAELGRGLEILRGSETPRDAIRPLRESGAPDLLPATQLATAADWAKVYLLSQLDGDLAEDLFLVPLQSEHEIERLLSGHETCAFLASAQHAYGQVRRS